ncbi:MAG: helix-turn-helix domain-containing protein [Lysobacterales bacterium]
MTQSTDSDSVYERVFATGNPEEWQAHVCEVFTQLQLNKVDRPNFAASAVERQLGSLHLADITAGGQAVHRGRRQIADRHADHCYLLIQKTGGCLFSSEQYDPTMLKAGDALLVDAQKPYLLEFERPSNQLCITVPNEDLRMYAPRFGKTLAGHRLNGASSVSRVLAAAIDDLQETASAAPQDLDVSIDVFYQVLTGCLKREVLERLTERKGRHMSSFNELVNFVAENLSSKNLTLHQAADELCVSARTLQRICNEEGTTFRKLVLTTRLTAAAHALRQRGCVEDTSITEVAYRFGFSDLSHFSRSFKVRFGVSPALYLKRRNQH